MTAIATRSITDRIEELVELTTRPGTTSTETDRRELAQLRATVQQGPLEVAVWEGRATRAWISEEERIEEERIWGSDPDHLPGGSKFREVDGSYVVSDAAARATAEKARELRERTPVTPGPAVPLSARVALRFAERRASVVARLTARPRRLRDDLVIRAVRLLDPDGPRVATRPHPWGPVRWVMRQTAAETARSEAARRQAAVYAERINETRRSRLPYYVRQKTKA